MAWPPRFLFISSRLALDFVHTGGEGFRARWERWNTPQDLAEWAAACPLLGLVDRPVVTRDELSAARELREAVWAASQQVLASQAVSGELASLLNHHAHSPPLRPLLSNGRLQWAKPVTGLQVLSMVARDAVVLFGTDARDRIRKCQNPTCSLMFVDTSRAGRRTWCTMQRCGNLNKISRYRGGPGLIATRRKARRKAADP